MASIVWCWNNDPTILSQTMTEGIPSVMSSKAVSLYRSLQSLVSPVYGRDQELTENLGDTASIE